MKRRLWTRDELILALNLYLKLSFGKIDARTPEVIHLASIINRTSNAVSMRLANFSSVDPFHQQRGIKGLSGGKKQVEPIWNEFVNNKEELLFESERILAKFEKTTINNKYKNILTEAMVLNGESKKRFVKTRVNQDVFRRMVLANYEIKCAITGINIPQLLIASHIIPWSKNKAERLNPANGICFSPLYDTAFDKGFIGINTKYEILLSKELESKEGTNYFKKYFAHLATKKLRMPKKYYPKKECIEYHHEFIFRK